MQTTHFEDRSQTISQEIMQYLEGLSGDALKSKDAAEIERTLLDSLINIGKLSLSHVMAQRREEIEQLPVKDMGGVKLTNKGVEKRMYQSIFGTIEIERTRYYGKGIGNHHPFDSAMGLPRDGMSHVLKDWLGRQASGEDYRQSVELLNEVLRLNMKAPDSKRNAEKLGQQVSLFYKEQAVTAVREDEVICGQWDGKGVPVVKAERTEAKEPVEDAGRLTKGEKRATKKTATVSVTSHLKPRARSKEEILAALMREKTAQTKGQERQAPKQENTWHEGIHRRALMGDQKGSIQYGVNRISQLHEGTKTDIVVLIDAGVGLEDGIRQSLSEAGLSGWLKAVVLDIIHVSEYVWKAANAVLGEKSKVRSGWVGDMPSDLLDSKTEKVIADLKAILDKSQLSKTAQKQLESTITYFDNHKGKMDYKACLRKGYPICTALVESCCGHLVKDRMEHSGMRWSVKGAQNILDIRAVKKNGDWQEFMGFVQKTPLALAA